MNDVRWTSDDVRRWAQLRQAVTEALDQMARRGALTKGMLRALTRAIGRANKAVFPTRDPMEIGRYRAFLQLAEALVRDPASIMMADALQRGLDRIGPMLDARATAQFGRKPLAPPPAQQRLPYADD